MRKTLTLLAASTALAAVIGVPGWSAIHSARHAGTPPQGASARDDAQTVPRVLASDDDDDDRRRRDHLRRDRDDDDDDDDDDDNGRYGRTQRSPAPAGTVAPPNNGLFLQGSKPKVQVN